MRYGRGLCRGKKKSSALFPYRVLRHAKKEKDAIFETAKTYLADDMRRAKSFKVESKRSDKSFPMTSIQLSQYVGGLLAEEFPAVTVDVHNPELTVTLEVRDFRLCARHAGTRPVDAGRR